MESASVDASPTPKSRILSALDNSLNPENSAASGSGSLYKTALQRAREVQVQQSPLPGTVAALADTQLLLGRSDGSGSPRLTLTKPGGFNLRYDNETPITSLDIGGEDQDQRMAEFVTKSIDSLSNQLTVTDAMKNLGLEDKKDLLPGLEIRLLPHQIIGVSWMLAQERSQYKGGILADDMGLGKTVQMIATMAVNQPDVDDECGTTLIVVPAALLQQWQDEIETKTNGIFSVHVHHGKDKLKKRSELRSKDVILTTYQTLNADFNVPKGIEDDDVLEWIASHGGILARTQFYRAVADEAQFIRNRATRASTSLALVRAKYRWMLTGTPVTNSLADIYGLIRFGRFRPWNDWNAFDDYICKQQLHDAVLAGERAQIILKPILLRRTKNSTLEGKPILQLPPKNIDIILLDFSIEERDLYDSFEKRTKLRLSKFIRERTLVKNHAIVLVMILRLRQLCCHPNLTLSLANDFEDPTMLVGSDSDKELARASKMMGAAWVTEIKKRFLVRFAATEHLDFADDEETPEGGCPVCKDMFINDNGRVLACGHEICFDCTLELSNSPIEHDGEFGHGDERQNLAIEKEYETAVAKGYRPCPTCKKMADLKSNKIFKASAFAPSDEELSNYARLKRHGRSAWRGNAEVKVTVPSTRTPELVSDDSDDDLPDLAHILDVRPAKRQKRDIDDELVDLTMDDIDGDPDEKMEDIADVNIMRKSADRKLPPPSQGKGKMSNHSPSKDSSGGMPSDAVIATWRKGDSDLEPSTKMLKLVALLKEWETTGDKTICYSQWTTALDLIEILFSRCGIQSLRYDGKMDRAARDATLATFKRSGGPRVILISIKCGGVGLNLVSANRIINMDLSWNYAAESQAYDRVHRLGQEKDVHVKRLVVRNTIEERMLHLQDVKVGLAEAALGEGSGTKLHKLSIRDIKQLFGMQTKEAPDNDGPRLERLM